jgi:hypothetical protein
MKKLLIIMSVLTLLLCGCGEKAKKSDTQADTVPQVTLDITIPTGAGEAVIPEEGDIVIPLG